MSARKSTPSADQPADISDLLERIASAVERGEDKLDGVLSRLSSVEARLADLEGRFDDGPVEDDPDFVSDAEIAGRVDDGFGSVSGRVAALSGEVREALSVIASGGGSDEVLARIVGVKGAIQQVDEDIQHLYHGVIESFEDVGKRADTARLAAVQTQNHALTEFRKIEGQFAGVNNAISRFRGDFNALKERFNGFLGGMEQRMAQNKAKAAGQNPAGDGQSMFERKS